LSLYHLVHCGNHRQLDSACRAARVFSGRSFHELHLHDDDLPSCPGPLSSLCAGFVCATIARNRVAPKVAGAVMVVLFLPVHYMLWVKFPMWYHCSFDFACSGAVNWRIASEQDRFCELMPMCCSPPSLRDSTRTEQRQSELRGEPPSDKSSENRKVGDMKIDDRNLARWLERGDFSSMAIILSTALAALGTYFFGNLDHILFYSFAAKRASLQV